MNGQDFSIFKKKVLSWKGPEFQSDTDPGPTHGSLGSHLGWAGLGVCVLTGSVSWGCHTWTHTTPPLSLVRRRSHLGWAGLGVCVLTGGVSWGCHTCMHTMPPFSLVRRCIALSGFSTSQMCSDRHFVSLHLVTKSCGEELSILARAGLPSGDFVDRVASSGKIPQVAEVGPSCMAPPPQASVTSEWMSEGLQWRCLPAWLPRPTTPATRMAPAGCEVDLKGLG